jgi:hypothetical protein
MEHTLQSAQGFGSVGGNHHGPSFASVLHTHMDEKRRHVVPTRLVLNRKFPFARLDSFLVQ